MQLRRTDTIPLIITLAAKTSDQSICFFSSFFPLLPLAVFNDFRVFAVFPEFDNFGRNCKELIIEAIPDSLLRPSLFSGLFSSCIEIHTFLYPEVIWVTIHEDP